MQRTELASLYKATPADGTKVTVCGWAKTVRDSKNIGFISLSDGSCYKPVQIVFQADKLANYAEIAKCGLYTSFEVTGTLVLTPNAKQPFEIRTMVYPGFPTDMQPQITVALCLAEGTSMVTEGVWDNRYRYVGELTRMGAQIRVEGRTAIVEGVEKLTGAPIQAYDLRAGAALVIAALAAEGESEISNVQYIERGYEDIIGKLRALGARIDCVEENDEPPIRQIG